MKPILRTRLQFIPMLIVIVFVVLVFVNKFIFEYPSTAFGQISWNLSVWEILIAFVVLLVLLVGVFFSKIYRKIHDHVFEKKILVIIVELLVLLFFFNMTNAYIYDFFELDDKQTEEIIREKNTTVIWKDVSESEVDAVNSLLPSGDPGKRENKVLEIAKVNNACISSDGIKNYSGIGMLDSCEGGNIVVKYGYDLCFPDNFDCVGDRPAEYYLIGNVEGSWRLIKKNRFYAP